MIPIFPEKEFAGRFRVAKKFPAFQDALTASAVIFRNTDERYWDEWTTPGLHLVLYIDDVTGPTEGGVCASPEYIEQILAFARQPGRENFVCCCQAGISRSSATAVLIAYDRTKSVESALSVLSPQIHWPNDLIIRIGESILGANGLSKAVQDWKKETKARFG